VLPMLKHIVAICILIITNNICIYFVMYGNGMEINNYGNTHS
jgi:hypothetical protein